MMDDAAKDMKHMWEAGQIRVLILTSLSIQIMLTFFAPFRKSQSKPYVKVFIWILYLLADVVAIYIIGLIQTSKGHHFAQNEELLAFWAPFLLLHLGGPDTITALALEDNELWRRHALQLTTQVMVTIYVFLSSLRSRNRLWLPTILMFLDGFIKYYERTCALFYASRDNFRYSLMKTPEAGPNYARLMEEYYSAQSANIPTRFGNDDQAKVQGAAEDGPQLTADGGVGHTLSTVDQTGQDCDVEDDRMVLDAHWFYEMYKTLLADGFLSLKDRDESRQFFMSKTFDEAFKIIQIELNLIYDAFYTKSFLLKTKRAVARLLCFLFVVGSLVLFCLESDDLGAHETDVIITFILFAGAIALDISAGIMFVFSDWWVIIAYTNKSRPIKKIMTVILKLSSKARQCVSFKRWSKTISKYNLLTYCFKESPSLHFNYKYIFGIKMVRDFLVRLDHVKPERVDDHGLIKFIINDIHKKAEQASDTATAKEVYNARGNLVLHEDYYLVSECLSPWTVDVDYDESVLIWHLATDICYHISRNRDPEKVAVQRETENENEQTDDIKKDEQKETDKQECRFSKALSDYMLYLVIWQQTLMSSVAGMSETRFRDTCAEARKFESMTIPRKNCCENCFCCQPKSERENRSSLGKLGFLKNFSEKVMKVKAVVEPMTAKGDKSKSVLFDACRLAHQLQMFGDKQWDITSKVWVELLCYAAARCPPRYHIAQLSKGGELITFVWLYMAHLGFGERFLQNQGFGWTKLIIEK